MNNTRETWSSENYYLGMNIHLVNVKTNKETSVSFLFPRHIVAEIINCFLFLFI